MARQMNYLLCTQFRVMKSLDKQCYSYFLIQIDRMFSIDDVELESEQ